MISFEREKQKRRERERYRKHIKFMITTILVLSKKS